jgi:hypothetical protein
LRFAVDDRHVEPAAQAIQRGAKADDAAADDEDPPAQRMPQQ